MSFLPTTAADMRQPSFSLDPDNTNNKHDNVPVLESNPNHYLTTGLHMAPPPPFRFPLHDQRRDRLASGMGLQPNIYPSAAQEDHGTASFATTDGGKDSVHCIQVSGMRRPPTLFIPALFAELNLPPPVAAWSAFPPGGRGDGVQDQTIWFVYREAIVARTVHSTLSNSPYLEVNGDILPALPSYPGAVLRPLQLAFPELASHAAARYSGRPPASGALRINPPPPFTLYAQPNIYQASSQEDVAATGLVGRDSGLPTPESSPVVASFPRTAQTLVRPQLTVDVRNSGKATETSEPLTPPESASFGEAGFSYVMQQQQAHSAVNQRSERIDESERNAVDEMDQKMRNLLGSFLVDDEEEEEVGGQYTDFHHGITGVDGTIPSTNTMTAGGRDRSASLARTVSSTSSFATAEFGPFINAFPSPPSSLPMTRQGSTFPLSFRASLDSNGGMDEGDPNSGGASAAPTILPLAPSPGFPFEARPPPSPPYSPEKASFPPMGPPPAAVSGMSTPMPNLPFQPRRAPPPPPLQLRLPPFGQQQPNTSSTLLPSPTFDIGSSPTPSPSTYHQGPLLTPDGKALAREYGPWIPFVELSATPLINSVAIGWPDRFPRPTQSQIRPYGDGASVGFAPIMNTGNIGPIQAQAGDWHCGVCGYTNWRRRKICQSCYPYAEGNYSTNNTATMEKISMIARMIAATAKATAVISAATANANAASSGGGIPFPSIEGGPASQATSHPAQYRAPLSASQVQLQMPSTPSYLRTPAPLGAARERIVSLPNRFEAPASSIGRVGGASQFDHPTGQISRVPTAPDIRGYPSMVNLRAGGADGAGSFGNTSSASSRFSRFREFVPLQQRQQLQQQPLHRDLADQSVIPSRSNNASMFSLNSMSSSSSLGGLRGATGTRFNSGLDQYKRENDEHEVPVIFSAPLARMSTTSFRSVLPHRSEPFSSSSGLASIRAESYDCPSSPVRRDFAANISLRDPPHRSRTPSHNEASSFSYSAPLTSPTQSIGGSVSSNSTAPFSASSFTSSFGSNSCSSMMSGPRSRRDAYGYSPVSSVHTSPASARSFENLAVKGTFANTDIPSTTTGGRFGAIGERVTSLRFSKSSGVLRDGL
ncbi:hypothetical protein DL93DRAFT_2165381 [Clavulina sp. PMI_390]|nr:hypothetical protein DL93DRAFT_2165381 [Clavulina sp. PMI_390]